MIMYKVSYYGYSMVKIKARGITRTTKNYVYFTREFSKTETREAKDSTGRRWFEDKKAAVDYARDLIECKRHQFERRVSELDFSEDAVNKFEKD